MRNTLLVLSGLLLAIMLAGCSSGGDGGAVNELTADVETLEMDLASARAELATTKADLEDTEDDLATAQAALATARTTLSTTQANLTAAQAELATAKDDLEEAESDLEDAQTELATAKSDLETANATLTTLRSTQTTTQADLVAARASLATAQAALQTARATLATRTTELTAAQTQVTQLTGTVTSLRTQLGQAQTETTTLETQVEEAEREVTAAQQENVRARVADYLDDADAVLNIAAADVRTATVQWMRGGTLQFTPEGAYTSTAAPSVPGGWSRSGGFTSRSGMADDLKRDTAYLYTNIQSPGTRAWWKVHGVAETVPMTADLQMLARGGSAQPNADTTPDVQGNDATIGHQYDMLTVTGSLGGVSGRFTCTTACTGTVGSETDGIPDDVTFVQGRPRFGTVASWTFERTGSITSGYQIEQDNAFLYFGIWDSVPDLVSGTPEFRFIAGGGEDSGGALSNFDDLEGTATFTGGAIGKYATQGQVGQRNASIGTFTATATFTVNFGDAATAGTLHGRITDFQESGTALAGWSVTLGAANVATPATIASGATSGNTVASIGGVPAAGDWAATFHGEDNQILTDRILYPATRYPVVDLAGVTGWFDAVSATAGLAGAFGATP